MTSARDKILANIRSNLGADNNDRGADVVNARLDRHRRNIIPARADLSHSDQVALFIAEAERAGSTIDRIATEKDIPGAVAAYLASRNLPARVRCAPQLQSLPWDTQDTLEVTAGVARPDDLVSVTPAFAGIAETGTLILLSGPGSPTTLNFLPENHIVVLRADQVCGPYEDAFSRLRGPAGGGDFMPRAVNMITGPSRSADIEQTLLMGAHGPKNLHVVLVDGK